MDDKKLAIIAELMDQLQDEMEMSKDDFADRLGKPKGIEITKVEGHSPELEEAEEEMGEDLDGDMEMGEDSEHAGIVLGDEMEKSPEDKLKERILKMRG